MRQWRQPRGGDENRRKISGLDVCYFPGGGVGCWLPLLGFFASVGVLLLCFPKGGTFPLHT